MGIHVVSTDEMTGIQAIERAVDKQPMKPRGVERLVRRLLKRSSFLSTDDLQHQILKFIDYFNHTFAKPFIWKFEGFE